MTVPLILCISSELLRSILTISVLFNVPPRAEIFLSHRWSVIWSPLFPLSLSLSCSMCVASIFHARNMYRALAWSRGLGVLFLRKREREKCSATVTMPLLLDPHWMPGFADGYPTGAHRPVFRPFPHARFSRRWPKTRRATLLPAKVYNKYGAIATITLCTRCKRPEPSPARRRYYCVSLSMFVSLNYWLFSSRCSVCENKRAPVYSAFYCFDKLIYSTYITLDVARKIVQYYKLMHNLYGRIVVCARWRLQVDKLNREISTFSFILYYYFCHLFSSSQLCYVYHSFICTVIRHNLCYLFAEYLRKS